MFDTTRMDFGNCRNSMFLADGPCEVRALGRNAYNCGRYVSEIPSSAMASSSQITYSYEDLLKKAEALIKTRPGLWGDLIEDLWIWQKVTNWLKVSVVFCVRFLG